MMNILHITLLFLFPGPLASVMMAEDAREPVFMRNVELGMVLERFASRNKQTVFLGCGVIRRLKVDIESKGPVSREEADELIRKTLFDRYQIQIREADTGEILVENVAPRKPRRERPPPEESPDATYSFRFPQTDLADVAEFYQLKTGRPVFVALDLSATVTFEASGKGSSDEAASMIRKMLSEKCGVEMRETPLGEVLMYRAKDWKAKSGEGVRVAPVERPRVRVRPIAPRGEN